MGTFKFVLYLAKQGETMTAEEIKKLYKQFAAGTKQRKSRNYDTAVLNKVLVSDNNYAAKIDKHENFINRTYPGVVYISEVIRGDWEIKPELIEGLK